MQIAHIISICSLGNNNEELSGQSTLTGHFHVKNWPAFSSKDIYLKDNFNLPNYLEFCLFIKDNHSPPPNITCRSALRWLRNHGKHTNTVNYKENTVNSKSCILTCYCHTKIKAKCFKLMNKDIICWKFRTSGNLGATRCQWRFWSYLLSNSTIGIHFSWIVS